MMHKMKKLFFLILLFCAFVIHTRAQSDRINTGIISAEQEFIRSATDSALFVIKQEYVMRDTATGKDYTLGGNGWFGRSYALAVMIDYVLWTDARLFTPWVQDTNFTYYTNRYGYVPVLTHTLCRPVHSNTWDTLEFSHADNGQEIDSLLKVNGFAMLYPENFKEQTLFGIHSTTDNAGWALVVYTDEPITMNDTCPLRFAIFRAKPDFTKNAEMAKQPDVRNIIGGYYVLTTIITGDIQFFAAGYIRKTLNWFVKPIPEIISDEREEIIAPEEIAPAPEEQSKSKKKNKSKQK